MLRATMIAGTLTLATAAAYAGNAHASMSGGPTPAGPTAPHGCPGWAFGTLQFDSQSPTPKLDRGETALQRAPPMPDCAVA